jgi:hypothetical protein
VNREKRVLQMTDMLFIFIFALVLGGVLIWGFRTLPKENWQVLACVPRLRQLNGLWKGINLTYYGFFNAAACVTGVALIFMLLSSISIPYSGIAAILITMLVICMPSSRLIAGWVEKKPYTLTIGGASFLGIIISPWVIWLTSATLGRWLGFKIHVISALAAVSIAYSLSEGVGRLACISFGCCYGKPMSECHPILKIFFYNFSFTFTGKTKKISYAHGLDGTKVFPIQAITSVIYCSIGLAALYLFLKGYYCAAFLLTLFTTQIWRLISEFLRADYRGGGKISAYQIMAIISILYTVFMPFIFPVSGAQSADILVGLKSLWNPLTILFLQFLWVLSFLYTGISNVTGVDLSIHVLNDRT